jgi:translation initiation factor eIF-2B subunit delta
LSQVSDLHALSMAEDDKGASKEATGAPILDSESYGAVKGKTPKVNGTSGKTTGSAKPEGESNGVEKGKKSDAGDGAQPKLSGAELKARAKAEKAARRAQTKDAKAPTAAAASGSNATPTASKSPAGDAKAGKGGKGKPDQLQQKQQQNQATKEQPAAMDSRPSQPRRPSGLGRRPSITAREKDPRSEIPDIFSHIPMAKRISTVEAHRDVHPAVLAVGQRMAAFVLTDSILRLEGALLALRKVCASIY